MKTSTTVIRVSLVAAWLVVVCLLAVPNTAFAQFATPTVNGTIASGEYGTHTDGQNQQTNGSQVWYMTWDDTDLYVGITGATLGEAAIIYLDKNPLAPINGGSNSDGTIVGNAYDGTNFAALQFRADLVLYVKSGYREYRTANGSNGWSSATTGFGSYADSGTTREFSIPWSVVGGRPSSFAWFGYLTSSGGFVYGQVPTENSGGTIGTSARYVRYYIVNNTGDGASTKPFSRNSFVFNSTGDVSGFGAISVYDFTMNSSGRTLTRGSGAWTITGSFRVDAGTVSFGNTTSGASMSGDVVIGSGGTLTLSSAIGGDLNVGGNWTNNGAFNANSRLVTFNGSGAQSIGGSSTTTFGYLAIASGSSTTLAQNANVWNDFEVYGAFSVADKTLTLQNGTDLEIKSGGSVNGGSGTIVLEGNSSNNPDFINAGTFTAGTGTVHFKGQSTAGNYRNGRVWGSSATAFKNVTLTYNGSGSGDEDTFGVDFYDQDSPAVRATINGVLALNRRTFVAHAEVGRSGGSCSACDCGAPTYDSGSTLRYNDLEYKEYEPDSSSCPGSPEDNPFQVFSEWLNATSGHGVPYHVTVGSDSWVSLFCNPGTNYRVNGDFTVEAGVDGNNLGGSGSTPPGFEQNGFTLGEVGLSTVTVMGDVVNKGTLKQFGPAIYIAPGNTVSFIRIQDDASTMKYYGLDIKNIHATQSMEVPFVKVSGNQTTCPYWGDPPDYPYGIVKRCYFVMAVGVGLDPVNYEITLYHEYGELNGFDPSTLSPWPGRRSQRQAM